MSNSDSIRSHACCRQIYISTRHLLFAAILTLPMKFTRFPSVKKERRVTLFLIHYVPLLPPASEASTCRNTPQMYAIISTKAPFEATNRVHFSLFGYHMALMQLYSSTWSILPMNMASIFLIKRFQQFLLSLFIYRNFAME